MDYRLEDYFCPACLSGHRKPCDGLDWWCECLCIADHDDVLRARQTLRLWGLSMHLPSEGDT